jgi:phage shock protein A
MGLLERVSTLIKANLNDLVDRAENPGTMIKQVMLDMENQLLQVKTQVAISIADQHMLEKKTEESVAAAADWLRKAELAVDKNQEDLARAAIERHRTAERTTANFRQQVDDQRAQVAALKSALIKLEQKLAEARAKSDILLAQHRRTRALGKAAEAQLTIGDASSVRTFERMKNKVASNEAVTRARADFVADDVDDRFAQLERDEEVDRLLAELKARRRAAG